MLSKDAIATSNGRRSENARAGARHHRPRQVETLLASGLAALAATRNQKAAKREMLVCQATRAVPTRENTEQELQKEALGDRVEEGGR